MSEERYFRERARIEQGHVKYRDKLKDEGKLFVRDRLKLLLDPGAGLNSVVVGHDEIGRAHV